MAKLTVTEIQAKEDKVIIRWAIDGEDGTPPGNYSGEFQTGDQPSIDAAFKKSLSALSFSKTISDSYFGKVISLDNKGEIAIADAAVNAGELQPG